MGSQNLLYQQWHLQPQILGSIFSQTCTLSGLDPQTSNQLDTRHLQFSQEEPTHHLPIQTPRNRSLSLSLLAIFALRIATGLLCLPSRV